MVIRDCCEWLAAAAEAAGTAGAAKVSVEATNRHEIKYLSGKGSLKCYCMAYVFCNEVCVCKIVHFCWWQTRMHCNVWGFGRLVLFEDCLLSTHSNEVEIFISFEYS